MVFAFYSPMYGGTVYWYFKLGSVETKTPYQPQKVCTDIAVKYFLANNKKCLLFLCHFLIHGLNLTKFQNKNFYSSKAIDFRNALRLRKVIKLRD